MPSANMPGAPDAGQEGDNGQTAYLAVKLLRTVVDKIGCSGKIRYSEVLDDCSVKRRVLLSEQLKHVWQTCLRSGEVIVSLLHASNKIQKMLSVHGCPLLPLQEGSERMDWLRLRSRFLGNWRNIQNVLRYMQKKCPHLRLETLDPNVGEVIVDRVDVQRSHMLTVASLTQCLALLLAQRITLEDLLQFQSPTDHVDQPQDANNSADHPRLRHRRRSNRNNNQRDQQPTCLQLQPKLERLNGAKRVTCVYDTTTTDEDAGTPATAAAGTTATAGLHPDGDSSPGGSRVTLSAETLAAILQRLDDIRSFLVSTESDRPYSQQPPTDTQAYQNQSQPLIQPSKSQFCLKLPQPPQLQPSIPQAMLPLFQLQQLQQSQRQSEEEKKQQKRVRYGGRRLQRAHRSSVTKKPKKPSSDCDTGSPGLTASAGDSEESEETAPLSVESFVKMRGLGPTKSALKGAKACLMSTSANRPQPTLPTCHQPHRQPKRRPHQRLRLLDAADTRDDSGSDSGTRNSDQDADGGDDGGSRTNSRMAARRHWRRKPPMGVEPAAAAVPAPSEAATCRRHRQRPVASGKNSGSLTASDTAAMVPAPAIVSDNNNGGARQLGIPTVTFPTASPAPIAAVTVQEANKNVAAQTLPKSTIQDLITRLQSVLGHSNI